MRKISENVKKWAKFEESEVLGCGEEFVLIGGREKAEYKKLKNLDRNDGSEVMKRKIPPAPPM